MIPAPGVVARPSRRPRGASQATVTLRCRHVRADARPDAASLTAELLSIGSELTVGETRDTNAGRAGRGR